jgi:hypothetical protein
MLSAKIQLIIFWGVICIVYFSLKTKTSNFEIDLRFSNTLKGLAMFLILYHHSGIYHAKDLWFFFYSRVFNTGAKHSSFGWRMRKTEGSKVQVT